MQKIKTVELEDYSFEWDLDSVWIITVDIIYDEDKDPGDYWMPPVHDIILEDIKVTDITLEDRSVKSEGIEFDSAVKWVKDNEMRIWEREKETLDEDY